MKIEVQNRIIYHVEAFKKSEEQSENRRFIEKYKDYKPVVKHRVR